MSATMKRLIWALALTVAASLALATSVPTTAEAQRMRQILRSAAPGGGELPGEEGDIAPAQFTYLGSFTLPTTTTGVSFHRASGAIAVREVEGDVHLFVSGSPPAVGGVSGVGNSPVYELTYPGVGNRASVITSWGEVVYYVYSNPASQFQLYGLNWEPTEERLWAGYGITYETAGGNPVWGKAKLEAGPTVTKYGPWATGAHSQKTKGWMVNWPSDIATALGGGVWLGAGAPTTSQGTNACIGPCIFAFQAPADLAPHDPNETDPTLTGSTLIRGDLGFRPYHVNTTDTCHWDHYGEADSFGEEPQATYPQPGTGCTSNGEKCGITCNHALDAGPFEANELDLYHGAAWVQTTNYAGLVMIGGVVDTIAGYDYSPNERNEKWYGPQQCQSPCTPEGTSSPHGALDPKRYGVSTGDATQTMKSSLTIFPRSEILAVIAGTKTNTQILPSTDAYDLGTLTGGGIPSLMPGLYAFGGVAWAPENRLLFVTQVDTEAIGPFTLQPIVHVFEVED